MAKNLVIVESPAKARTISKFLGSKYKVVASMGHIRDLPKSGLGVDVEKDFHPTYEVTEEKKKVVAGLKKDLKDAETLWIATDEDREGEAIGWHLLHALGVKKDKKTHRIVFHEITKSAIEEAVANPKSINMNVVDAQQARRVLDRLVGYELSPLLWKKIKYGLSAGRVQSVAVRLIVDREREIEAFKPEEYWKIFGDFLKKGGKSTFEGHLQKYLGKKFEVKSSEEAEKVLGAIEGASYKVVDVQKKEVKKNPAPPFTTSTLQQEASRKLNFSVKKTMMVAQGLYEGINLGDGEVGLITYMRTDSVSLSKLALDTAKKVIANEFGKEFALAEPRFYKGKKGAQEAHEAIRPVDLTKKPEMVKKYLTADQFKLYSLIWKRTIACQMKQAILDQTGVDIEAFKAEKSTGYTFRATGQVVRFAGFMEVYMEGSDSDDEGAVLGEKVLPELAVGEVVALKKMNSTQHFTKPPARYTEASLVKKLEQEGIGRPSTYAPTISTIITRGYIEKEGKSLRPMDIALVVTDFLVEHFRNIVDYKFTAEMEDKLDSVEEGKQEWVPMIREFYTPFHENIVDKGDSVKKEDVMKERALGVDEKSGLEVVARHGRFGPYVQLGNFTKEELDAMTEKPRRASIPNDVYIDNITLEEAMVFLALPKSLGVSEGEEVIVSDGRFGPYLKHGKKNYSLPPDVNPHTVKLEEAVRIIKEEAVRKKKMMEPIAELGVDPESKGEIFVKDGRFGPYVTDGKTNVSLRKGVEPKDITFDVAVEMLKKKRETKGKGGRFGKKK
ncbi:type I DNA topoisomerase [Candidatus Peregrinibacteria bacterium HGW-Peregrinibacteria-1]|jgi:DNA topoisomerase-1|nr:MAG: type I DNA topoisomerase [Candidatus Peregrinibacteria bacterium HGW-Peregrinibacteria-1]